MDSKRKQNKEQTKQSQSHRKGNQSDDCQSVKEGGRWLKTMENIVNNTVTSLHGDK